MNEPDYISNYGTDRPTGCLPRLYEFATVCAAALDDLDEVYEETDWDRLLDAVGGEIDFGDCIGTFYDQDGYGSCAHASLNKAAEIALRQAGVDAPELNHWWSYGIAVNWRGGPRVGTNIDQNLLQVLDKGMCPVSLWPYSKGPNSRPPVETYEEAKRFRPVKASDCSSVEEVWTCLYKRWPVVIGWNGHSECLVGLRKNRTVKVCGSYGPTYYGGQGYHYEKIDRIEFGYGAFAIQVMPDLQL